MQIYHNNIILFISKNSGFVLFEANLNYVIQVYLLIGGQFLAGIGSRTFIRVAKATIEPKFYRFGYF